MSDPAFERRVSACATAHVGQNAAAFDDEEPPTAKRRLPFSGEDYRPPTVLVAEPDAEVRTMYAEQLADLGCRVRTASHADEALRVAAESPPDLVLIDVSMARACRGHVTRWLREAGAARIAGIAPAGSEWDQHAREARLDALVRRPTARAIFEQTVRDLLPSLAPLTIANNVVHRITGR